MIFVPMRVVMDNDLAGLREVSSAALAWLDQRGAGDALRFDVSLVIEEIVTNRIKYGWPDAGRHEIAVEIAEREGHVVVRFEDDGEPFDPREAPPPEFPESPEFRRPGGLGLHLVRGVADVTDYRSEHGVNRLEIVVREPMSPSGGRTEG